MLKKTVVLKLIYLNKPTFFKILKKTQTATFLTYVRFYQKEAKSPAWSLNTTALKAKAIEVKATSVNFI